MDDMPRRDDPIHRIFKKLRDGFSEVVVNIAERVERRIQIFIDDERHEQPSFDLMVQDVLRDVATVMSGVSAATSPSSVNDPVPSIPATPDSAKKSDDEP